MGKCQVKGAVPSASARARRDLFKSFIISSENQAVASVGTSVFPMCPASGLWGVLVPFRWLAVVYLAQELRNIYTSPVRLRASRSGGFGAGVKYMSLLYVRKPNISDAFPAAAAAWRQNRPPSGYAPCSSPYLDGGRFGAHVSPRKSIRRSPVGQL